MPTEKEMMGQLKSGKISLPPLSFRVLESGINEKGNQRLDALVEVSWQGNKATFIVACKALSTPKAFQGGINLLKSLILPKDYLRMLFLPFLGEKQLLELEREGISGIDLCGNGVVIVPGMFSVFRSGEKNRFPSSAPIKNVYRKNSSMVGRVFLVCHSYKTVQEIQSEINRRNMLANQWDKKPLGLPTVSKVLKSLEQDLIVERNDNIRLLQPDKLLEKLSENYTTPNIKERVRIKISEDSETIRELLVKLSQVQNIPIVASGTSSVTQYAAMQRGDLLTVYCPSIEALIRQIPGNQTDRFQNLELVETEDETAYFDARQEGNFWWASPIQAYLELMVGDKRDRETAEQLKTFLLRGFKQIHQ